MGAAVRPNNVGWTQYSGAGSPRPRLSRRDRIRPFENTNTRIRATGATSPGTWEKQRVPILPRFRLDLAHGGHLSVRDGLRRVLRDGQQLRARLR